MVNNLQFDIFSSDEYSEIKCCFLKISICMIHNLCSSLSNVSA